MRTSNTGDDPRREAPEKLPLAVTMGDPSGIGLDVTLLAWRAREELTLPPFVLYAEPDLVRTRAHALRLDAPLSLVESVDAAADAFGKALPVLALPSRPDLEGASTVDAIERATDDVLRGKALALVTNPITKAKPGFDRLPYPGHTEFLADLAQRFGGIARPRPVMLLASETLCVVPTTVHIPLARVPAVLTADLLRATILTTHAALIEDFGIASPRMAVAGLNPHAGEGGLIGQEEAHIIAPVIRELRQQGLDLSGPMSADTLFHAEARNGYDAAIAMYHDQALIPIKTIAFDDAVNVTLGLPFVRTSPDHGTAVALAGTGKARPESFIAALRLARAMALRRAHRRAPVHA